MKFFFKSEFPKKTEVNYFYFSLFFLFLTGLSLFHFLYWEVSIVFIFYAIGQSLFEVLSLILIASLLRRWAPSWVHSLFISISFLILLLHFTNFTMVRLMDASLKYVFKFLFGSGIDHLVAGLQALNMNWTMIGIIVLSFLLVPLIGLGFYWITFQISRYKPLSLSLKQLVLGLGMVGSALFTLDLVSHSFLRRHVYDKYQKTLPFGTTFLSPTAPHLLLPQPLAPFRKEEEVVKKLPKVALTHLPNIYVFVIETFRKDYLEAAPHLTAFGKENLEFEHSYANANTTHLSWFSIFHSNIPFYWTSTRDHWKGGSLPLRFLKKLGYKIRVYSSSDLKYFNMDKLLFGNERELADRIEEYTSDRGLEPCQRDVMALSALNRDLEKEGNIYLVFFDSTHSEYSFPMNGPLKYEPIAKEIDYLTIGPKSPELELIKNRYRNAIHHVDHLMGQFFTHLKEKNLFNDAMILITGDHGEEFFEEGALFHGTHLNQYQTSVPIFLKFPSADWVPQTNEITHIDLFPSMIHYLTKQSDLSALFDGRSIFSLDRHPYRIAVLQNGPDTPFEFSIQNSEFKAQARFVSPTKLEIIHLQGFLEPAIFSPLLKKGP